jgi:hypothetical protein
MKLALRPLGPAQNRERQRAVFPLRGLAVLLALLVAAAMPAAEPAKTRVSRGSLVPLESSFDVRMAKPGQEDPFDLLGNARGVYLEGYGVVFTAEINLIVTPPITPFRPQISKEEIERIHQRKLAKLQVLKKVMREMMASSAASIDGLPANEQVVVAVTLFYYSWENRDGLPSQILMQAPKGALAGGSAQAAVQVKEF